jgi:hypothetical protein
MKKHGCKLVNQSLQNNVDLCGRRKRAEPNHDYSACVYVVLSGKVVSSQPEERLPQSLTDKQIRNRPIINRPDSDSVRIRNGTEILPNCQWWPCCLYDSDLLCSPLNRIHGDTEDPEFFVLQSLLWDLREGPASRDRGRGTKADLGHLVRSTTAYSHAKYCLDQVCRCANGKND